MALEKFNDLESLSSVRTKINATIDKVNALGLVAETHNPVLTFDKNKYTETAISQSGAIAYTLAGAGNVDGVVIRHKILSDGTNPITFSVDFNVFGKSSNDLYPAGLQVFYFNYVGGDVDVSIPTYDGAFVAPDTFAPTYISTYPKTANVSDTSFDAQIQLNEAGTAYLVVVADGAAAPTSAEVKAGTGSGGTGQVFAGNVAVVAASTTATISATGLAASTSYDVYVVAEDDEGTPNIQASPVLINQTMGAGPDITAPTISSATVEDANPSILVVGFNEVVTITDVTGLTIAGAATPTLSAPTGSGTNTLSFTLSAPLTSGQTVTLEVAGTNNIIDGASNALVAISQAITNNVGVAVSELVVFEQFVSASSPSAGELVNEAGGSAWGSGAYGTKAFNGAGTVTFDAPVVGTSSGGLIAVTNAYTGIVGSNFNFDMGVALVANSPGYTVIHGGVTEPELAWNGETAKLNVRADGFVEIFMDDTLVYTSAQAYTFPLNVVGLLLDSRTNSVIHNATLTSSNLITSTI